MDAHAWVAVAPDAIFVARNSPMDRHLAPSDPRKLVQCSSRSCPPKFGTTVMSRNEGHWNT
jgi:hypothetical protein